MSLEVFFTTNNPTMMHVIGPKIPGQIMPMPIMPYLSMILVNFPFFFSSLSAFHFFKTHFFTKSPKKNKINTVVMEPREVKIPISRGWDFSIIPTGMDFQMPVMPTK